MEYLFKASLVLIIFYGCYKLFLQRDTFFQSNRWFLLIGLLTAFTLPFMVIPVYIEYTPTPIEHLFFNTPIAANEAIETPLSIWYYLGIIYLIGFCFFALRFCIQLTSLLWLIAKNKKHKQQGYTFVETTNNTPPFSFFRWMVYDPNQFNSDELYHIISHECIHIKQWHTLDIIISQLASITFWFNPISWFYKKDLQQNLEFIADYKALNNSYCTKTYQELLLKTSIPDFKMALTNNFYSSLIKKRIVMLHKSKSKKRNLFKYALVLPFLALFLMSFNIEEVYVEKVPDQTNYERKLAETYIIKKSTTDTELREIKEKIINKGGTFTYAHERDNQNNIIDLEFEIKNNGTGNYKSEKPFKEVYFGTLKGGGIFIAEDEKNYKELLKRENGKLKSSIPSQETQSKKDPKKIVPKNNIKPFSITINKDFTDEDLENAKTKAKEKGITLKFSKIKRNAKDEIIAIHAEFKNNNGAGTVTFNSDEPIKPFTYSQDDSNFGFGKPRDSSTKRNTYSYVIKADTLHFSRGSNIKSLDSLNFYEYNISSDSINFFSKKNQLLSAGNNNVFYFSNTNGDPLFIIDSVEVDPKHAKSLNPDKIHSFSVLKGDNATVLYGKKAKDGVVLITTKKDGETNFIVGKPFNSSNNKEQEFIVSGTVTDKEGLGLPGTNIIIKGSNKGVVSDFDGNYKIKVSKGDMLVFSFIGMVTKAVTIDNDSKVNVILEKDNITLSKEALKALLIIDGKEETNETIEDLDVNTIESMTVIKGENATKKYGDKGKNGVIEIITKKD